MDRAIQTSVVERMLRRDRVLTLIALFTASLLAWAYIAAGIGMDMEAMSMPDVVMPANWTFSYFGVMFAMWAIMMIAMMLPSAAPMVLLFALIERRRSTRSPFQATALFAVAYLVVWAGFSLFATILQWQFDRVALLTPSLATSNTLLAAIIMISAGVYQFTPLKQACLRGCRSPIEFVSRYWSRGPFGMGVLHGIYCLGCCWVLMLLLFIGGVMNLVWVALIAGFVLLEKVVPRGEWLSYVAGVAMISGGGWVLYAQTIP